MSVHKVWGELNFTKVFCDLCTASLLLYYYKLSVKVKIYSYIMFRKIYTDALNELCTMTTAPLYAEWLSIIFPL